jgi:class 3 adenylate cyclase/tetratricopeptide (TPR) repeat protein
MTLPYACTMLVCSRCGRENPDDSRYCGGCGAELAARPAAAAEERKVVTLMFADVTGSTALGERLDAEAFKEVMGSFFEAMRAEIEAEGGTVEKFIGDAIMAAFGVPRVHEDDPARALRAALRMRSRLRELNATLEERHNVTLELRIGINTGEVLAVVDPRPGEALATGDAVNAAARLEQSARPGEVLVAERTAQAARGFHFSEPRVFEVRGKSEPLRAVELVAEQAVAEGTLSGARVPLVGRIRELALLDATYRGVVSEGRPHLVTLYGDAGVGKSRLVAELLASLEASTPRPRVVRGRCLSYGDGVTFWPLAELLKSYAEVLDTDRAEVARKRVVEAAQAALEAAGIALADELAVALAASIGLVAPDRPRRNPHEVRGETHTAWRAFFSALATAQPTIVLVEDVHWADPALLELLEDVADRTVGPMLMLCTARPELTAKRPTWGGGRRSYTGLVLEPLAAPDSERLIEQLGGEAIGTRERRAILARAEGNPFFLEEIIRTRRGPAIAIPDTVQAALAARIDLLPADEKGVLQAAAVVGRVFWPGAVAEVTAQESTRVDVLLDGLQDRDLVLGRLSSSMKGERELIFKHALVRDVAYDSLPRRDRLRIHSGVAGWIEETFADRRGEVVELVGHHRVAAHRLASTDEFRPAAFSALVEAAETALERSAFERALSLATDALQLAGSKLERARALEVLGYAAFSNLDGSLSWESLREAADIVLREAPDERARLAQICAHAVMVPSRAQGLMNVRPPADEVRPYLELGLASSDGADSEALVLLLASQAYWEFGFGIDPDPAGRERGSEAAEQARAMARRIARPDLELLAMDAHTSGLNVRGLYGLAAQIDGERLELARTVHDSFEVLDSFYTAGWTALEVGRYEYVIELADEVLARDLEIQPLGSVALTALAHVPLGNWDEGLAAQQFIRELMSDASTPPSFASGGYGAEALILVAREDPLADERLTEVEAWTSVEFPRRWPLPFAAVAYARRGEFDSARRLLDLLDDQGVYRPRELEARCALIAEEQSWAEAEEVIDAARRFAHEGQLIALPLHAARLEGHLLRSRGQLADARDSLELARAGFASLNAQWEVARTELVLAEVLIGLEQVEEAASRLEHAEATFARMRVPRELAHARKLLDSLR